MAAPQEAGSAAIQSVISEQVISEQESLFNWKKSKEQRWHFVLTVATGSAAGSASDLFGWHHLPCICF